MAVGNFPFPAMLPVPGLRLGSASAGIKKPGRQDLVLMELAPGSRVAGVFTRNRFCAAPVTLCREHLARGDIRYLITNAGNANACTGEPGMEDARATCAHLAQLAGVEARQVLPFSTGVIGERLPMERLLSGLPGALASARDDGWELAAHGIMTTDTRPKGATSSFEYQGETVVVSGVAKGSGMIKPNMATMLAYVATNAKLAQPLLQDLLQQAVDASFNRITVDGDTSTNDSCVLIATGQTGLAEIDSADSELYRQLAEAVIDIHRRLAHCIVADGEGATKFVTIQVDAAASGDEALKVAYAVAHSPLVKTALFACDPNWGRIVAAIGYAGIDDLDPERVNVWLGEEQIVADGGRAPAYEEARGQAVMDGENILIRIDLGRGRASDTVWTTDLSHEYVTINAEYRT